MRQRIRFFQQLAVLTRAGVPLRSSLQRLQERISGHEMTVLTQQINAGEQIGASFAKARFSPFECHLVIAGERSGRLEDVFQHLAEFWTRQRDMIRAFLSQLYYPLSILHLAILVGALIEAVSSSLMGAVVHLIMTLAFLYTGIFVAYMLIRASWQNDVMQRFWLSLPLIGKTLSTAYAYRWVSALKLEYSAGIPMPDAVADAWRASGYANREQLALEGQTAMREGTELSALMLNWKQLPRDWIDFIETGEVSGALETALQNLESEAATNWRIAQQRMTDWMPKIVYGIIIIVVGIQIFTLFEKVMGQTSDAMKMIDDLSK